MEDLDVIEPSAQRSVSYRGQVLRITPLEVGQYPRFTRAMRPILEAVAQEMSSEDAGGQEVLVNAGRVFDWIEQHGERLFQGLAIAARCEQSLIEAGTPDELIELTVAVLAVNLDFFARRLLPRVRDLLPEAAAGMQRINGGGPMPSSPSSPQDTH